jgi:hypothetical protein
MLSDQLLMRALAASVARAGAFGVAYTEKQLYYELCRTLLPLPELARRCGWWSLLLPAIGLTAWPHRGPLPARTALVTGTVLLALAYRLPYCRPILLAPTRFAVVLQRYRARYGDPPGLLGRVEPPTFQLDAVIPDLAAYGLPRLLLCQDAAIAHMLLANNLHMEVGCAILALNEQQPLADPLRAMLANTPNARVFVLHDASRAGIGLFHNLRRQLDLPATARLAPLGLRPLHAQRLHLFARREPPSHQVVTPSWLAPSERSWLAAGWCAEVAAISPTHLLRALRRLIAGQAAPRPAFPRWSELRNQGFMDSPGAPQ